MSSLFNTLLYEPFYNTLIFLINTIPGGDVGIAVVILTIIVKLALFSVSYRASVTQIKMKEIEPEIKNIKERNKNNNKQQGIEIFELYKKNKINPFSGIIVLFIQIPVIIALYLVFLKGGLPDVRKEILYSFIEIPETISMTFLGIVDLTKKNLILAIITSITQFLQTKLMYSNSKKEENYKPNTQLSIKDELARNMQLQMRYIFPVVIGFITFTLPAAVAIYWITSNTVSIVQDSYIKKRINNKQKFI